MSAAAPHAQNPPGAILVVDDYEDARKTVRELLEDHGHVVIEAADGQEALNVLVSAPESVGLIVLDLNMPVMDGWKFLKLLGNYIRLAGIPVLIVTAYPPRLSEITHPGIVGCLNAPYEAGKLLSIVNAHAPLQSRRG
jgi:CheY-like chemotaxis protein